MTKSHSAGGIVVNPEEKIVLVQTDKVFWTFPKGRVKSKETRLATAIREIREETGLDDLTLIKKIGTYKRTKLKKDLTEEADSWKITTIFLFRTHSNRLSPSDLDITDIKWVEKSQVAELLTHPEDRRFFQNHYLNQI